MRKLVVIIVVALLVIGAVLAPITGALAHSDLVSNEPADDAELSEPPRRITLEFNEAVRKNFGQVEVTGPNGDTYASGELRVDSSTVTQPLADRGEQGAYPEGEYEVGWRVVSADGHPVSGSYVFRLGEPGAGDGTAEASDAGDGTADAGDGTADGARGQAAEGSAGASAPPTWAIAAGAVVLAGLALAAALLVLRNRRQGE